MEFEWDADKAQENLRKHKVSFTEACESFSDPEGFVLEDTKHSDEEDRFYWIGKTTEGRVLTTRYTMRGKKIRIIGFGEWREFKGLYNEKTKCKES